jgi:hypothetical protein
MPSLSHNFKLAEKMDKKLEGHCSGGVSVLIAFESAHLDLLHNR